MQEYILFIPRNDIYGKIILRDFFVFTSNIKKMSRPLEALRLQPLGRTTAVCFSMVLDLYR